MFSVVLVVHVILALLMIVVILVQQGKGAEAGASFGGGGASTVFGATGAANFMTRLTAILTTLFFITSITLVVLSKRQTNTANTLPNTLPTQVTPTTSTGTPVSPNPAKNQLP